MENAPGNKPNLNRSNPKKNSFYRLKIKEFREITSRTRELLDGQEGYNIDFKKNVDGIKSKDIVAFANSKYGGTILCGVAETQTSSGIQRGKIVGCAVSDKEKIKIVNKAQSCFPTIDIEIIIENTAHRPLFRIEIFKGKNRPYCTNEGAYLIRGDGRNIPLSPNDLLDIFLEEQGEKFLKRFNNATIRMNSKLLQSKKQIDNIQKNIDILNTDTKKELHVLMQNMKDWTIDMTSKFESFLSFYRMVETIYNISLEDIYNIEGSVSRH